MHKHKIIIRAVAASMMENKNLKMINQKNLKI